MRNILVIGAYERDNFGDFLFFEVARRIFPEDNVIPGSLTYADQRAVYGIETIPYDFVLTHYKVDAILVAGGELGTVDIFAAANMSLPIEADKQQRSIEPETIIEVQRLLGANTKNVYAYIPDMRNYKRNKTTPLIINSIGLSFSNNAKEYIDVLSQAAYLSVREKQSFQWAHQLDAQLHPDIVHSLASLYKPARKRNGISVQINKQYIDTFGVEPIVNQLVQMARKHNQNITVFAAGVANSHDDPDQLKQIVKRLKQEGIVSNYSPDREPLKIVDLIAGSYLTVATSLHVRIVSATFGVPRVSLENQKVTNYVESWDYHMPYDVSLEDISAASEEATRKDVVKSAKESESRIQKSIQENVGELIAAVPNFVSQEIGAEQILEDYSQYKNTLMIDRTVELYTRLSLQNQQINTLQQDLLFQRNETWELIAQMRNIVNSRMYKKMQKIRAIKHKITKSKV